MRSTYLKHFFICLLWLGLSLSTYSAYAATPGWVQRGWQKIDQNQADAAINIWQQGINQMSDNQLVAFLGIYNQLPDAVQLLNKTGRGHATFIVQSNLIGKKIYYVLSASDIPANKAIRHQQLADLREAAGISGQLRANAAKKFKRAVVDMAAAEQLTLEKAATEKAAAEQLALKKAALEKAATEKAAAEQAVLQKAALEKAAAEQTAAKQLALKKAALEKAAAEQTAAEQVVLQKAALEKTTAAKAFDIKGNKLVTADVIQATLNPLMDAAQTTAGLFKIKQAVIDLYQASGFAGVAVAIPVVTGAGTIALNIFEADIKTNDTAEHVALEKAAAEHVALEKAAAEQAALEKAAAEQAALEKAAAEQAALEKAAAEQLALEKAAAEQLALEKAAAEQAALEKAAAEQLALEKAAAEQAALEKAAAEQVALEKAAAEQVALEKAAAEQVALEKAAAEQAALEKTAAEHVIKLLDIKGNTLVSIDHINDKLSSLIGQKKTTEGAFKARQMIIDLYQAAGHQGVAVGVIEQRDERVISLRIFEDDIDTGATKNTSIAAPTSATESATTLSSDWIGQGWKFVALNNINQAMQIWQQGVNNLPADQLLAFLGVYSHQSGAVKQLKRAGEDQSAIIVKSAFKGTNAYYVMSAQHVPANKTVRADKLAALSTAIGAGSVVYANAASKFQTAAITTALSTVAIAPAVIALITPDTADISDATDTPDSADASDKTGAPEKPTPQEEPKASAIAINDNRATAITETGKANMENTPAEGPQPVSAADKTTAINSDNSFSISAIEISGNSLISSQLIQQQLQSHLGQNKTTDDIFKIKQAIIDIYNHADLDGVAVAVPDIMITNILAIHVFEEDIQLETESVTSSNAQTPAAQPVSSSWLEQGWQQLDQNNSSAALATWQAGVNSLPSDQLLAFLGVYTQVSGAIKQLKRAGLAEKAIILQADFKGKQAYYVMSAQNVPANKSIRRQQLASLHQAITASNTLYANAAAKFQTAKSILISEPTQKDAPQTFNIHAFNIIGNKLIADETIQNSLKHYLGEYKTREDLLAAKQSIVRLYRDEGYEMIAVGIPRKIDSETISLRIFETKVGKVWVSGKTQGSREATKQAFPDIKAGTTPNADQTDEQLREFSKKKHVESAKLIYHPGTDGTVDIEIHIEEKNPLKVGLMVSNLGTQEAGLTLFTGILHHNNLWNNIWDTGHVLTLSYTGSERIKNLYLFGAAYEIPITPWDGTVILGFSKANVASGKLLGILNSRGHGIEKSAHYEQTIYRTDVSRHYLDIGYEYHLSRERFFNVVQALPFSVEVSSVPIVFGYGYERSSDISEFKFQANYYRNSPHGLRNNDAVYQLLNPIGGLARWQYYHLNAKYDHDWSNGWSFAGQLDAQLSNNPLPTGERLFITGQSKVRGFEEIEAAGDSGFFMRTALISPYLLPDTRFHFFIDGGRYQLNYPIFGELNSNNIASTGLGMRWTPSSYGLNGLNVLLEAGVVLNGLPVAPSGSMTGHFKFIYWLK